MKRLILIAVVNTVLFLAAELTHTAVWKLIAAEILVYCGYVFWFAWFSPAQQLINQASHMRWDYQSITRDGQGFRDALLIRDDVVAKVSWSKKCVFLIEPEFIGPFNDFLEVEHYLMARNQGNSA